jgi:predicted nuclease of predicted toxin-antitoxin system
MRLKMDENLGPGVVDLFRSAGHDVHTVVEEGLRGSVDERVAEAAQSEDRILMTMDLDFANPLRLPPRGKSGVIILRPPLPLLTLIVQVASEVLPFLTKESPEGKIWIVEMGRIRIYSPRR